MRRSRNSIDDMALPIFLHLKRLQWAGHIIQMGNSCNLQKVTGGSFRRRNPMGKPTGRWKNAVWRDDIYLLQIWNWKLAAKKRECWRKKTGEAMA
jgi:hypothetical protein